jgi:hypothetical protein
VGGERHTDHDVSEELSRLWVGRSPGRTRLDARQSVDQSSDNYPVEGNGSVCVRLIATAGSPHCDRANEHHDSGDDKEKDRWRVIRSGRCEARRSRLLEHGPDWGRISAILGEYDGWWSSRVLPVPDNSTDARQPETRQK